MNAPEAGKRPLSPWAIAWRVALILVVLWLAVVACSALFVTQADDQSPYCSDGVFQPGAPGVDPDLPFEVSCG